jgi:hypothetical protein
MIAAPHGAAPYGAAPPVSAFRARRAKHKSMNPKKNQAPSTHGPSAITEGAQQPRTEDPSSEEPSSESGRPGIAAQVDGEFNADLWREQVLSDQTLVASQKLILLVLSTAFDSQGHCETTHDWLAERTATGVRLIREYTPILEQLGWYSRKRKRYSMEYTALRGRDVR